MTEGKAPDAFGLVAAGKLFTFHHSFRLSKLCSVCLDQRLESFGYSDTENRRRAASAGNVRAVNLRIGEHHSQSMMLDLFQQGRNTCFTISRKSGAVRRFVPLIFELRCSQKVGVQSDSEEEILSCFLFSTVGCCENGFKSNFFDSNGHGVTRSDRRIARSTSTLGLTSTVRKRFCDMNKSFTVRIRVTECTDAVAQRIYALAAENEAPPLHLYEFSRGSMLSLLVSPEDSLADVKLVGCLDISDGAPSTPTLAHRLILSSQSSVFRRMFASSFKESAASEIQLEDISGKAVTMVVRYLYGAEFDRLHIPPGGPGPDIPSWKDELPLFIQLWTFSSSHMLEDLRRECEDQLKKMFLPMSPIQIAGSASFFKDALSFAVLSEKEDLVYHFASCFHEMQLQGSLALPQRKVVPGTLPIEGALHEERVVPAHSAPFMDLDLDSIIHLAEAMPPTLCSLSFLWFWLSFSDYLRLTNPRESPASSAEGDTENSVPRMVHGAAVMAAFHLDEMNVDDLRQTRFYSSACRFAPVDVLVRIIDTLAQAN